MPPICLSRDKCVTALQCAIMKYRLLGNQHQRGQSASEGNQVSQHQASDQHGLLPTNYTLKHYTETLRAMDFGGADACECARGTGP